LGTQEATIFRIAVDIVDCVRKQKRRDILRGDIAGGYRLSDDGGGTAKSRTRCVVEGVFVNEYERAVGTIAIQSELVSARKDTIVRAL
jgi:hypothetical protein